MNGFDKPKSGFNEREKAFESKYHLDEEIEFKANVRRAKLLGLWAAKRMGLAGDEAQAYGRSAVDVHIASPGHGELLKKIARDLEAKQVAISPERLQLETERLWAEARQQIVTEVAAGKQAIAPE